VDLIAAWPGQTIEEWRRDMAEAMSFNAQHYSVYELTFKPGTPMHLQFRTGELTPATEELRIEMFEETERLLSLRGYEHYEISNYAKPGARSRHNANYWQLGNYAGLGAGAHSFIFPHRYINANNARDYQQAVSNGKLFRRISNSSDPIIFLLENLQLALRLTEGVNLDDFSQRFGTDIRSIRSRKLADLVEAGYAELTNAQLKLTPAGRMRIDSISEYLLT
jgi:oxygen-independent coproporphyrinogen-3 oxidase